MTVMQTRCQDFSSDRAQNFWWCQYSHGGSAQHYDSDAWSQGHSAGYGPAVIPKLNYADLECCLSIKALVETKDTNT
jgi:hypothetical protein